MSNASLWAEVWSIYPWPRCALRGLRRQQGRLRRLLLQPLLSTGQPAAEELPSTTSLKTLGGKIEHSLFRKALVLLALLLVATPTQARAKEIAQRVARPGATLRSAKFWLGELIIFGSLYADARTTVVAQRRCRSCVEQSPLLPRHPAAKRVYLTELAGFGGFYGAVNYGLNRIMRDRSRGVQVAAAFVVPGAASMHGVIAARHNAGVRGEHVCPSGLTCR